MEILSEHNVSGQSRMKSFPDAVPAVISFPAWKYLIDQSCCFVVFTI